MAREVIRKFFYWPLPLNGSALRTRDARRIGVARAKAMGVTINTRLSRPGPWFASLDLPRDTNEKAEIQKAVAEWADRDTVAAHFAYTNFIPVFGR
jgi:hypothetical protein